MAGERRLALRRPSRDALAAGGALAAAALAVVVAAPQLALAAAGLLALVLPGAAVAWVVAPRLDDRLATWVVAGGIVVGIVGLEGLALNLLPVGVARLGWVALGGVALVSAWALAPRSGRSLPAAPRLVLPGRDSTLLLVGAVVMCAIAVAVARMGVTGPAEQFSQLWLTRGANGAPEVEVGIRNLEQQPTSFRLEAVLDGHVVQSWADLRLDPGASWTATLRGNVPAGSRLEARLYIGAAPDTVYRRVALDGPIGDGAATVPAAPSAPSATPTTPPGG